MCIFAAIFGISFILDDSTPCHQAHHSGSHFTVMSRFSTAVFTLSRPTKAFQTDDSWNYSCRHPTNLIITSCTITVSSILWVIKAWWVFVCVCVCSAAPDVCVYWVWRVMPCDSDACLILNSTIFSKLRLLCLSFRDTLNRLFAPVNWSLSCLQSTLNGSFREHCPTLSWVHSTATKTTQWKKKKQQRFLPRTVPALLNSGWGMLADSSVHFLCWRWRPQSSNRFNSTAREPLWSFYFLALLRLGASRRCSSW